MKKKNKLIIIFILIIILILCFIFIIRKKYENIENKNTWENPYVELKENQVEYNNDAQVDEIKQETGIIGDSDLYEVTAEYDGRKVLNIKANVQFGVAFAGIIKQEKPEMDEIDQIINEYFPIKNGIWIEQQSRTKILGIIKSNTKSIYKINEEGYLIIENKAQQNDNDKKLEKLINTNKKIILTVNSFYYEVDNVTGEIVEYPFEKLDNYQVYDKIESNDNLIIVITSNLKSKLNDEQILEELLQI